MPDYKYCESGNKEAVRKIGVIRPLHDEAIKDGVVERGYQEKKDTTLKSEPVECQGAFASCWQLGYLDRISHIVLDVRICEKAGSGQRQKEDHVTPEDVGVRARLIRWIQLDNSGAGGTNWANHFGWGKDIPSSNGRNWEKIFPFLRIVLTYRSTQQWAIVRN